MATKVIDNNEVRTPFLGDKMSFITGQDPLGLQNPSTQAYTYLLPGLNNVTSRIKNYSFYCWLLEEFASNIKSDDPAEQRIFIRRAEYIISLLSVHSNIENISGSTYANNRLKEGIKVFNLQTGTYNEDGSTYNTYWQSPFGIFGQYYIGSLRQIGLLEEPVDSDGNVLGLYRRTARKPGIKVSGEDLANAFDANVSVKNKTTFFNCIKKESVSIKELEELAGDFNLKELNVGNLERELLLSLLLDVDEPLSNKENSTFMRRDSIIHILKFIESGEDLTDQHAFSSYAYNEKGIVNKLNDNALTGWYYYQLNEYYHVANTAIFNGCLNYLQELVGPGWMSVPELVIKCKDEIISHLVKTKRIKSSVNTIDDILKKIDDNEQTIFNEIMSSSAIERMANGFLLLLKLYPINKTELPLLRTFATERGIGDNDDVITYYLGFGNYLIKTIESFIYEFIAIKIISRHEYVAYRKMGGGSQSTQKFIIEENNIRQIGNFKPGYTSPRIENVKNFLSDLKLLDDSYNLTTSAKALLKTI